MAVGRRNPQAKSAHRTVTRIGANSTLTGTLKFSTSVTIDGRVKGEIISSGELFIGASAVVEATIRAGTIVIDGLVRGKMQAAKRIEMREHAKVYGDVAAPALRVVDGVIFEGRCTMLGDNKNIEDMDIFSMPTEELRGSLQQKK